MRVVFPQGIFKGVEHSGDSFVGSLIEIVSGSLLNNQKQKQLQDAHPSGGSRNVRETV
jgi:hypothetical protein